jgi:peptide chain release factor 1
MTSQFLRGSDGHEMALLAEAERLELISSLQAIEYKIIDTLTPRDSADERGVILEVRAGTGWIEKLLSTV